MTTASELFYNRRFRIGRNAESAHLSPLDRTSSNHPHHHHRRHRHYRDDDHNPSPRRPSNVPPHARHLCHRFSQSEHESIRSDHVTSPSTGSSGDAGTSSNRVFQPRITAYERLPGAVLQARARLLERLRGVSITANSQSRTDPGISWDEFALGSDFRAINTVDLETELGEWLSATAPASDTTDQLGQSPVFLDAIKTKPLGLSREAINSLPREVFDVPEDGGILRGVQGCCICLENFEKGQVLTCLPCDHWFHPPCLDPWVQACGDCPYCRTCIVVDDCKIQENSQISY